MYFFDTHVSSYDKYLKLFLHGVFLNTYVGHTNKQCSMERKGFAHVVCILTSWLPIRP